MTQINEVLRTFLIQQQADATDLAAHSDVLELMPRPVSDDPPLEYLARFHCTGLAIGDGPEPVRVECFDVHFGFHPRHLRQPNHVLIRVLDPLPFHPNIVAEVPVALDPLGVGRGMACIGTIKPCTDLVSILYRVHALLTYHAYATHDGFNPAACQWARDTANQRRFPLDSRPLRRPA